jgi:hypothetical protein
VADDVDELISIEMRQFKASGGRSPMSEMA